MSEEVILPQITVSKKRDERWSDFWQRVLEERTEQLKAEIAARQYDLKLMQSEVSHTHERADKAEKERDAWLRLYTDSVIERDAALARAEREYTMVEQLKAERDKLKSALDQAIAGILGE